jgi:hypothetical protein
MVLEAGQSMWRRAPLALLLSWFEAFAIPAISS